MKSYVSFENEALAIVRSGILVLLGCDRGFHVMLSQTMIALLLMAAVVLIYVLAIKSG
jgi:hypothetical protein